MPMGTPGIGREKPRAFRQNPSIFHEMERDSEMKTRQLPCINRAATD